MGDNNVDGEGNGVDGDGSGGTSLSQQGAGTDTSVPQNWSLTAAVLRNFSGKNTDWFRVFTAETFYRRRGDVRGGPGGPHHTVAQSRGRAILWCGHSLAPLRLSFRLCLMSGKIEGSGFISSSSENISCVTFLKHKNSRKQGTGTVASRY
jgi:hypothetical protein